MFGKDKKQQSKPGPVAFVIGGDPDKRIVIFQFGHPISRLEFAPEEALEIASNIMSRAAIAAGKPLDQMIAERQALKVTVMKAGTPLSEERVKELEAQDAEENKQ